MPPNDLKCTRRICGLVDPTFHPGMKALFSSNSVASLDEHQWKEFMAFIQFADVKNSIAYLNKKSVASNAKRVGWARALEVYKKATGKGQRSQKGVLHFVAETRERS